MPQEINPEDLINYGIKISIEKMDNGEMRFRMSSARSSYIRTETKEHSDWQNSHYHSEQTECFFVEEGEVTFVAVINGIIELKKYYIGDYFSVMPMIPHNMKISKDGLVHTLKYGGKPDWKACPQLDRYLRMNYND